MDQHIFYYVIGSQISIESSNSAFWLIAYLQFLYTTVIVI
jgi:hypothetical protein